MSFCCDQAGSATSSFPGALTNLGKDQSALGKKAGQKASAATTQVSSSAGGAADSAKKGAESAKQGASKTAGKAAGKAKNAAPDLSQLPDPGALLDKVQGKVGIGCFSAGCEALCLRVRIALQAKSVRGLARGCWRMVAPASARPQKRRAGKLC